MLRSGAAAAVRSALAAREALCSSSSAPLALGRAYCAPPAGGGDADQIGNEKVRKLADEITNLTVLECSWLSEILRKKLGLTKPAFGAMPMMPMMAAGAAAGAYRGPPHAGSQCSRHKRQGPRGHHPHSSTSGIGRV